MEAANSSLRRHWLVGWFCLLSATSPFLSVLWCVRDSFVQNQKKGSVTQSFALDRYRHKLQSSLIICPKIYNHFKKDNSTNKRSRQTQSNVQFQPGA